MTNILQRDGLTIELLARLSYKSELGINLKKNLHYFDKDALVEELIKINEWYDEFEELHSEIETILITDKLVDNWTYPLIQPKLIEEAHKRGFI